MNHAFLLFLKINEKNKIILSIINMNIKKIRRIEMLKVVEFNGLNDYIFKEIFKNKRILVEYINVLLDLKVKEDEIEYNHSEIKGDINAKGSRFDILITTLKSMVDFEAQKRYISREFQIHRKIHYASQIHSNAYNEGELYFEQKKTYVIFLLDYKFVNSDLIYHKTKFKNIDTNEEYDDIEILEISLKNIKNDDTIKERMLKVLSENDISKYHNDTGIVKEVVSMISHFNEEERAKCQARFEADQERTYKTIEYQIRMEGIEEGLQQGLQQGREQGIELGVKKVANKLKLMNISVEEIASITGLSIEEIKKL